MDISHLPISNVSQTTQSFIRANYMKYVIVLACLLPVAAYGSYLADSLIWLFGWVALVIAGYGYIHNQVQIEFLKQFGASIGFAFTPTAALDTVSGKLFTLGHDLSIVNVLSGTNDGLPMRIFSYHCTVGYGKQSHHFVFTVFESTLSKSIPEIILNPAGVDYGAETFSPFDSHTHVQLEGDFNGYFNLSVPKGFEMEAYQIFTPNVMADLIDKAANLNFEFSGNRLYVYQRKELGTTAEMQGMFDLVDYLLPLFERNLRGVDVPTAVTH